MNNAVRDHIAAIVAAAPSEARLVEYEGFRDPDLGTMVGVILELDTGDLYQVSCPANEDDDAEALAAEVAGAVVFALLLRPAEVA